MGSDYTDSHGKGVQRAKLNKKLFPDLIYENTRSPVALESSLTGTGACPGRVTGRVQVVLDPRGSRLEPGEILVARELRLPCIVSLPGITTTLKTGDLIEMDGATGTVRILEARSSESNG